MGSIFGISTHMIFLFSKRSAFWPSAFLHQILTSFLAVLHHPDTLHIRSSSHKDLPPDMFSPDLSTALVPNNDQGLDLCNSPPRSNLHFHYRFPMSTCAINMGSLNPS